MAWSGRAEADSKSECGVTIVLITSCLASSPGQSPIPLDPWPAECQFQSGQAELQSGRAEGRLEEQRRHHTPHEQQGFLAGGPSWNVTQTPRGLAMSAC
jgi:hypothetical protein